MGRRFEFTDDDDDNEDEDFEFLEGLDDHLQIIFHEIELNQELLEFTVKFLEKSFFWRFRRLDTRLRMIKKTYETFLNLVSPTEDD